MPFARTNDVSGVPLTPRALYRRAVQGNLISSTRLVQISHMNLKINGPGHPKKGPLGHESEAYKWRRLDSSGGGGRIHYLEQCIFHLSLIQSALRIPPWIFH